MLGDEPNIKVLDVLIEDNIISKIDENISEEVDKIIDGNNKVLMPGLVNTHTHLAMALFRGYKDEKKLEDWLNNAIFPVEAKMREEDVYNNALLSCLECIRYGTTTVNDMYFMEDEVIKAIEESNIRAVVSYGINDFIIRDYVKKTKEGIKKYNNDNSLIKVIACFHAPYTCSPDTINLVLDICNELNVPIHTHLSETKEEESTIQERYGKSSTKYLYDLGVFNYPVILAHSIHMSNSDLELLKGIKGGMSNNPISNAKLASGVCDVVNLRKLGFNVGLGSDGAGSTTTLDMFEEMKTCAYLQKLKYSDPTIIKAYDILKMATIEGAKVLGLDNKIGTIEKGKCADLILVDLNNIHLCPTNDICTNLVFSANGGDVDSVIVNGKVLLENKNFINIDVDNIMKKIKKSAYDLLK